MLNEKRIRHEPKGMTVLCTLAQNIAKAFEM